MGALGANPAGAAAGADSDRALPRWQAYQLLVRRLALLTVHGGDGAGGVRAPGVGGGHSGRVIRRQRVHGVCRIGRPRGGAAVREEALEDALLDVKAEGLVLAVQDTGLTPLMELDVLASGGVAVSTRTTEDEGRVGLASSWGRTVNIHCM